MTPSLLNWMWQSTSCLGTCWLFYHMLLRRERLFQFNRAFLVLTPLLAAVLPLLSLPGGLFLGPELELLPAKMRPDLWLPEVRINSDSAGGRSAGNPLTWAPGLYVTGVVASLVWQLGGLFRLWLRTRRLPRRLAAGYTLRLTGGQLPISSFGRTVYWDETAPLTPEQAAQVLAHELAHIRLGHTADRLWLRLWQAVLWFNPFVHLHARALTLAHEYQADAAAVQGSPSSGSATDYTALLARQAVARWSFNSSLAHTFSTSQTLNRIAMLHQSNPPRRWKPWLALPLLGLLFGALACDKAGTAVSPEPKTAAGQRDLVAPPPPPPAPPVPPAPGAEGVSRVYDSVERMPEYRGGMNQLMSDLAQLVKYPEAAKTAGLEGKVFVGFVVGADGRIHDVKLRKGFAQHSAQSPQGIKMTVPEGQTHDVKIPKQIDAQAPEGKGATLAQQALAEELNQIAVQAVRNLPGTWEPGKQDGQAVAVSFTIPITFAFRSYSNMNAIFWASC